MSGKRDRLAASLVASLAAGLAGCFSGRSPETTDAGGDAGPRVDADEVNDASAAECEALPVPSNCFVVTCGRCYLVCYDPLDRAAAVGICTSWDGSHLAQPRRETERTCLGESITSFGWVDLNQADAATTADAGWSWDDGTAFTGPWADGEPEDSGGAPGDSGIEQCGALEAVTGLPLDIACGSGRAQPICVRD